jgi:hypothetical protein
MCSLVESLIAHVRRRSLVADVIFECQLFYSLRQIGRILTVCCCQIEFAQALFLRFQTWLREITACADSLGAFDLRAPSVGGDEITVFLQSFVPSAMSVLSLQVGAVNVTNVKIQKSAGWFVTLVNHVAITQFWCMRLYSFPCLWPVSLFHCFSD